MQGLTSFGSTVVSGALSIIDLRLPFAWFAGCLGVVAWLALTVQSGENTGRKQALTKL